MTKTDFINNLDFEVAKTSIARKLGIKPTDLVIKPSRSGDFRIDIKDSKIGSLLFGTGRAVLTTNNLSIKENKDSYSYDANIHLDLKNRSGEYSSKVGKLNLKNDKFVFYTVKDLKNKSTSTTSKTGRPGRPRKNKEAETTNTETA